MRAFPVAACATMLFARVLVADPGTPITEAEFLAPLESAHPALVALGQSLAEAEAAAQRARTLANPELGASRETPGELEQLDVSVSWQLPHPGRRRLAIAAADAGVAAARSRLEAERRTLRLEVREAFARWAASTATVEALKRWSGALERLAARERERAESGEVSGLDARRLVLAAGDARGRAARAEAERLETLAVARAWRPDLPPDAVPELPALEAAAATAEDHPLLVALRAELEAAEAEQNLASRVLDMPSLSAGWQRQEAGGEVADGATAGILWTVPVFDRRQPERERARARVETTKARLALAEREIQARRDGALAAYGALRSAATTASEAAGESGAVIDAATAAFQAGETTVTDLLDALRSATETRIAAFELYAEALAAQRRLEQVSVAPLASPAPTTP